MSTHTDATEDQAVLERLIATLQRTLVAAMAAAPEMHDSAAAHDLADALCDEIGNLRAASRRCDEIIVAHANAEEAREHAGYASHARMGLRRAVNG